VNSILTGSGSVIPDHDILPLPIAADRANHGHDFELTVCGRHPVRTLRNDDTELAFGFEAAHELSETPV